jgi:hypothetical protein
MVIVNNSPTQKNTINRPKPSFLNKNTNAIPKPNAADQEEQVHYSNQEV